ncbi:MAG TPA: hypothetical protein DCO77_12280 [Nitrospiraceae bacterium]|nr:hypothetical protein [Nitrospiraceae bacterium]
MTRFMFRAIGYSELAFVLLFIVGLFYVEGTFVAPLLSKALIYCLLLVASAMGIILLKKALFITTFYVYPFLSFDRFHRLYDLYMSEKIGFEKDQLKQLYISEISVTILILCFYFLIILFLTKRGILSLY